jgi:hypothetical protein
MRSVLILSTCYDRVSFFTSRWAAGLHDALIRRKDTVSLLYDAGKLSRTDLQDAIERVDYVVFYGHGGTNEWIALPSRANAPAAAAISLVDAQSVRVLNGRSVYAGCCWSLAGLGQAYLGNPSVAGFVGYNQEFDFEFSNEAYFKEVVNQSVIAYVHGDSAQQVATDLQTEWTNLAARFRTGYLKRQPNSAAASGAAHRNSQRVGALP